MNSFLNGAFPLFKEYPNSNENNNNKSLEKHFLDNHVLSSQMNQNDLQHESKQR